MKVKRPELSLLKKIFFVDLIKGLLLTFSYQRPSANYTEQYPKVRPKVAERFRGAPRLNNDPDTGETLCIACNLCALACPEHCIEVGWERDKQGKKVLTDYTRSEEHTSELQSQSNLVCRLLLEKKKS